MFPTYQDQNEYVIEFSHIEIYNETVKDLNLCDIALWL